MADEGGWAAEVEAEDEVEAEEEVVVEEVEDAPLPGWWDGGGPPGGERRDSLCVWAEDMEVPWVGLSRW